jgi:hypothetical protein
MLNLCIIVIITREAVTGSRGRRRNVAYLWSQVLKYSAMCSAVQATTEESRGVEEKRELLGLRACDGLGRATGSGDDNGGHSVDGTCLGGCPEAIVLGTRQRSSISCRSTSDLAMQFDGSHRPETECSDSETNSKLCFCLFPYSGLLAYPTASTMDDNQQFRRIGPIEYGIVAIDSRLKHRRYDRV